MTTKTDTQAAFEKWLGARADDPSLPHGLMRDAFCAGVEADRQGRMPSDDEILACLRPLYSGDEVAAMGAADDLRTAHLLLSHFGSGQPAASAEPLVRYCPGCGSIGPVPEQYRDCCPDGSDARMIPQSLAEKCRDTFQVAVKVLTAEAEAKFHAQSAAPVAQEPLHITHGPLMREAASLLRLRRPVTPDFERVAVELEHAADGHPTPAGDPSPGWLHIAALAAQAQHAISGYTHTVPDDCETLHWRGNILSMNELASVAQPAVGEEIHIHIEGQDVLTLPLASSGMDAPRFVVHVPAQAQPIMPPLTDAMRAVLRNEHCVYDSEDALYAALVTAAQMQSSGNPGELDAQDREDDEALADTQRAIIEAAERRGYERAIAECAQDLEDAGDPLQGAVKWLLQALPGKLQYTHEIAARLMIGYNRAERLVDAARAKVSGHD